MVLGLGFNSIEAEGARSAAALAPSKQVNRAIRRFRNFTWIVHQILIVAEIIEEEQPSREHTANFAGPRASEVAESEGGARVDAQKYVCGERPLVRIVVEGQVFRTDLQPGNLAPLAQPFWIRAGRYWRLHHPAQVGLGRHCGLWSWAWQEQAGKELEERAADHGRLVGVGVERSGPARGAGKIGDWGGDRGIGCRFLPCVIAGQGLGE